MINQVILYRQGPSATQFLVVLGGPFFRCMAHDTDAARGVLDKIADGLGVTRGFICHAMDAELDLD